MRVQDLIDVLPASTFTYQCDLDLELRGLVLDSPKRKTCGHFLYPRDASWPKGPEESPLPNCQKTEQTIEHTVDRGVAGIICSSELMVAGTEDQVSAFASAVHSISGVEPRDPRCWKGAVATGFGIQ